MQTTRNRNRYIHTYSYLHLTCQVQELVSYRSLKTLAWWWTVHSVWRCMMVSSWCHERLIPLMLSRCTWWQHSAVCPDRVAHTLAYFVMNYECLQENQLLFWAPTIIKVIMITIHIPVPESIVFEFFKQHIPSISISACTLNYSLYRTRVTSIQHTSLFTRSMTQRTAQNRDP